MITTRPGPTVVYSAGGWRLVIQFLAGTSWRGDLFTPGGKSTDVYSGKETAEAVVDAAVTSLRVLKLPDEAGSLRREWMKVR